MVESPRQCFESFLTKAVGDWIESFRWCEASSSADLRAQIGKLPEGYSRTHKTDPEGNLWALDIKALPGTVVGVDLELVKDRPILQNPQWLAERFQLNLETCSPKELLQEWVSREAVFKAFAPHNSHLMLSSFYKLAPHTYAATDDESKLAVEVGVEWGESWVLALARRRI